MPSPARKKRPPPRRSPIQGRAQHTVEAILKAAAQILERHGAEAATTNAIAERAERAGLAWLEFDDLGELPESTGHVGRVGCHLHE